MGCVTRVKICGITSTEDAERAADLGAWALGLVFWPDSPRACDPAEGERIGARMRRRLPVAGVFFDQPLDEVAGLVELCRLPLVQLHGDEGPSYCREVARRTGAGVIKGRRVRDAASVRSLEGFREADYHLLDAHVPGRPGGTGETFSWTLANRHRGRVPVVLSGGLGADNVGEAIRETRPFAVDTASGTEASPGRKDEAKLKAFFRAVAAADEAIAGGRAVA